MSEIQGKSVLIVGFAREGKSTLAYLQKKYPNLEIAVADKNPEVVKGLKVKTYSGENYLKDINEFDTVVKSPGIPPSQEFETTKHITSHINIFFEDCKSRTIGVTGTKGKSTTASLIAHILDANNFDVRLVGNVGKPALDFLNGSTSETIFVLELSSYQLANIRYSPTVAVLLPIYEEHLNYHGTFENYWQAKASITKHQAPTDCLVYYSENEICQKIADSSRATKIPFTTLDIKSNLLGKANKINLAAAFNATKLFINEEDKIESAISTFKPLPHRLEPVGIFNGVEFINDSLATIPEATSHALEALAGKVETLIAGGFDRGVDYSKIGPIIASSGVKSLVLFPTTGAKIEKSLPKNNIKIFHTDSMDEAIKLAYSNTSKGKVVLLSPASTSFNLFKDYEERGNAFKKFVEELGK